MWPKFTSILLWGPFQNLAFILRLTKPVEKGFLLRTVVSIFTVFYAFPGMEVSAFTDVNSSLRNPNGKSFLKLEDKMHWSIPELYEPELFLFFISRIYHKSGWDKHDTFKS